MTEEHLLKTQKSISVNFWGIAAHFCYFFNELFDFMDRSHQLPFTGPLRNHKDSCKLNTLFDK